MTTQLPPSGVPVAYTASVTAPSGMTSIGGVKIETVWTGPATFYKPKVTIGGVTMVVYDGGQVPGGYTWFTVFPARTTPVDVEILVDFPQGAEPGSTAVVTAQGAATKTGNYPLNPDSGGDPTFLGEKVVAGDFEILSWQEWRRLTAPEETITGS